LTDPDDAFEQATYLNKIGLLYRIENDLENAISYQEQCYEKLRSINNKKAESITLRNLGSLYSLAGRHVDSLRAHQLSLAIKRTIGDTMQVAHSLMIFAQDLEYAGKYDESEEKFKESLELYKTIGDSLKIKEIEQALERIAGDKEIQEEFEDKFAIYDDDFF
jgi:tetratricopeptide (TPR) repeat protein